MTTERICKNCKYRTKEPHGTPKCTKLTVHGDTLALSGPGPSFFPPWKFGCTYFEEGQPPTFKVEYDEKCNRYGIVYRDGNCLPYFWQGEGAASDVCSWLNIWWLEGQDDELR